MKNQLLLATSLLATSFIFSVISARPAEAFRKPWTQVMVAQFGESDFRRVCGNGTACSISKLDQFCKDTSGQRDAFYRFDGEHRCWVRRLRW